jgi:uncharacterized membrane protein YqiK
MEPSIVEWLTNAGRTAFAWSLGALLLVNAVTALVFVVRQDRALVNRWTSRVLALDLLLVGTAVGVPLVTTMARMTVTLVSSSVVGAGLNAASAEAPPASSLMSELRRK